MEEEIEAMATTTKGDILGEDAEEGGGGDVESISSTAVEYPASVSSVSQQPPPPPPQQPSSQSRGGVTTTALSSSSSPTTTTPTEIEEFLRTVDADFHESPVLDSSTRMVVSLRSMEEHRNRDHRRRRRRNKRLRREWERGRDDEDDDDGEAFAMGGGDGEDDIILEGGGGSGGGGGGDAEIIDDVAAATTSSPILTMFQVRQVQTQLYMQSTMNRALQDYRLCSIVSHMYKRREKWLRYAIGGLSAITGVLGTVKASSHLPDSWRPPIDALAILFSGIVTVLVFLQNQWKHETHKEMFEQMGKEWDEIRDKMRNLLIRWESCAFQGLEVPHLEEEIMEIHGHVKKLRNQDAEFPKFAIAEYERKYGETPTLEQKREIISTAPLEELLRKSAMGISSTVYINTPPPNIATASSLFTATTTQIPQPPPPPPQQHNTITAIPPNPSTLPVHHPPPPVNTVKRYHHRHQQQAPQTTTTTTAHTKKSKVSTATMSVSPGLTTPNLSEIERQALEQR